MNRSSYLQQGIDNPDNIELHDDGIKKIMPYLSPVKPKKVILADFDSPIYWTLYEKSEDGTIREFKEEDLDYLYGKLDELILKILNRIETYFDLDKAYFFIRGDSNFRKSLFPDYKIKRKERPPLANYLYSHMESRWNAIKSINCESEDMCYSFAKKLNFDCVILYCDHDIEEIPLSILYNYKKDVFKQFSEKEAYFNKISKLIIGESGDGVNFSKGLGKKHLEKFYNVDMTEEEIEKQLLISYTKVHKTEEKAKEMLELAKKLVYLHDIN